MKKYLFALFLVLTAIGARAVSIDGIAPDGSIQQVGVTNTGFLDVNVIGSSTSLVSVSIAGPFPVPVALSTTAVAGSSLNPVTVINTAANPVVVSLAAGITGSTVTVIANSTLANLTGQGTNAAGSGFQVLPQNLARYQSTIINTCGLPASTCGANLYIGGSAVSTSVGFVIPPGGSYSPDGPASFQGEVYGASTATVTWAWISH